MKKKNESRQHKRKHGIPFWLTSILGTVIIFISVYALLMMYHSDNTNTVNRDHDIQPVPTQRSITRPTIKPYTRPTSRPTTRPGGCGTFSSPVTQCRFSNGTSIHAKGAGHYSSRVRVTVRCGSRPCRFSHRDFELYSGATGEYPDWDRSNIPDIIAPNQTATITLKYRRFIGNDSVLRFHALGYVDAWLKL